MRTLPIALCLSLLGCVEQQTLKFPALENAGSALVLYQSQSDLQVFGIDPQHEFAISTNIEPTTILLLSYPRTLAQMSLPRGLINGRDKQPSRKLPRPNGAQISRSDGMTFTDF